MTNIQKFSRKEAMFSLIEEWQKQGTPKKLYCQQARVGIHTFNYWLKQFKRLDKSSKQGFTEYKIVERALPCPIKLNFPNGVTAEFPINTEITQLQSLINNWQACSH